MCDFFDTAQGSWGQARYPDVDQRVSRRNLVHRMTSCMSSRVLALANNYETATNKRKPTKTGVVHHVCMSEAENSR